MKIYYIVQTAISFVSCINGKWNSLVVITVEVEKSLTNRNRVIDITFWNCITYVQCAVISMHMKLHNGTFGAMNGLFLRSKNWCYRNGIAFWECGVPF